MADDHEQVNAEVPQVTFHFIKANGFRVIHCDGALGAPSPDAADIHMAVFSERMPLPVQVTQKVVDGNATDIVTSVSRKGIVREIEADIVMQVDVAEALGKWLLSQVTSARQSMNAKVPHEKT